MKLFELAKTNYNTYKSVVNGTKERHTSRICLSALVSLVLAIFSTDASLAYPMMVTAITILTGFTFTALFSDHVLADAGLPRPLDESDRHDLQRLAELSRNFKARSSYFILLSIINSVLLILDTLKLSIQEAISEVIAKLWIQLNLQTAAAASHVTSYLPELLWDLFFVIVSFIFLECLYTVYRLSETIVVIVNIGSDYIRSHENRNR